MFSWLLHFLLTFDFNFFHSVSETVFLLWLQVKLHSRIRLVPPKLCDINYLILSEVLFSEMSCGDNNSYCAEQFFWIRGIACIASHTYYQA